MSVPYRHVKGMAIGKDDVCALCSQRSTSLVIEHCHAHGYTRGLACSRCNSRLARIDAGAVRPTPREVFYLANCPECRRTESNDSPDARTLRIGAIALAISVELGLSPRQAAALALSLAHDGESESESEGKDKSESESGPGKNAIGDAKQSAAPDRRPPSIAGLVRTAYTDGADAGVVKALIRKAHPDVDAA